MHHCRLELNVMAVIFWFVLSNRGTLCALKFYLILVNLDLNIYTWLAVESSFLWGLTFINFGIGFFGLVCRVSQDPLQPPQPPSPPFSASPLTAKVMTVFYWAYTFTRSLHLLLPLALALSPVAMSSLRFGMLVCFGYLYLLFCFWHCYPSCRDPF